MKKMTLGLIFMLLGLAVDHGAARADESFAGYAAKERYSVEFTSSLGGCIKESKPETFTVHFGERNKAGQCLDNSSLNCFTRYTSSLGAQGAFNTLLGPSICSASAKGGCTEVQFSFDRLKGTDEDAVTLVTYEVRNKKLFTSPVRFIKVADVLDQTRRFVIAFGACEYAVLNYKVTRRP